ncbi:MAG: hypothetical protein V4486_00145 [Patescibacteria group bacterium]
MSNADTRPDNDTQNTQVNVLVASPGQFGLNNVPMWMEATPPEMAPGISFLVYDADGPLGGDRFKQGHDGPSQAIQKWTGDKTRFSRIQITEVIDPNASPASEAGDDSQPKLPRKFFGAGGDPAVGKRLIEGHTDKIQNAIRGKDFVFNWGAGGGGIGTPGMRKTAECATEVGVPYLSVLHTPFNVGQQIGIAERLRLDLRKKGRPLLVYKNANLPEAKRKMPPKQVLRTINEACSPLFRTFHMATQRVGSAWNFDLNDFITAMKFGPDGYHGAYDAPTKASETEGERRFDVAELPQVVTALMSDIFQDHDIVAKALLFCFCGPWTMEEIDIIEAGVREKTGFPTRGFIKRQTNEEETEMWVSVLAFGTFASELKKKEAPKVPAPSGVPRLLSENKPTDVESPAPVKEPANDIPSIAAQAAVKSEPALTPGSPQGPQMTIAFITENGRQVSHQVETELGLRFKKLYRHGTNPELREAVCEEVKVATGGDRPPKWGEMPRSETRPSRLQQMRERLTRRFQVSTGN